jgi:hypothetical protein
MNDAGKMVSAIHGLVVGSANREQTQKMCETIHVELAMLKQIAIREDGSVETKKAREELLILTLLLDGEDGTLEYLVKLRDGAREDTADSSRTS